MEDKNKGSDDPKDPDNGNPPVIDLDNPKPEDIKNLQKALSDKDVKLKDAEKIISDAKQIADKKRDDDDKKKKDDDEKKKSDVEKLGDEIKTLRNEIGNFNIEKKKGELEKEYPDILPELLVGKTDEQIKAVVEKQREMNKKNYGDSRGFLKPKYESADDVEKEIEETKKNKSLRGDNAAIKVMRLTREKLNFNK